MSNTESQGISAVGFFVMAFNDENAADETLKMLKDAKKHQQFYFEDAGVITQDAKGKVHYHETGDMHSGKGAGVGALIGGIVGILGGPVGVALGAGAGAAIGAVAAHGDDGFKDESLQTVGVALRPGTSALTVITSHDFLKAVQQGVSVDDIHSFVKGLANEISNRLEAGQDMALGIILAEDGLAFKEVAIGQDSAEVFGYVETDEGVAAGAAVITAGEVDYGVVVATEEGMAVEAGVITEDDAVVVDYVAIPEETAEEEVEEEGEEEVEEAADTDGD